MGEVHHMKHSQLLANSFVLALAPFFLVVLSLNTFALVVSSSISLLQMLEPRALWMLQARLNFKGVEKSFF